MASAYTGIDWQPQEASQIADAPLHDDCKSWMQGLQGSEGPMCSFLDANSSKRMAVRAVPRMHVQVSMGGLLTLP